MTALGFPLPPVSFMTAPTKKPISLGLRLKRAASSGWAATTRLQSLLQLAAVGDLGQPLGRDDLLGGRVARPTCARRRPCASLPESVPSSTSLTSSASAAGGTGQSASPSLRGSSTRASTSLMTQLAARFAGRAGGDRRVEVGRDLAIGDEHARVLRREALRAGVAGEAILGQLGQAGAQRDAARLGHHQRRQIGLGEVAVVVRLLLRAHRLRHAARRDPTGASPARRARRRSSSAAWRLISCSIASRTFLNEFMFLISALVP